MNDRVVVVSGRHRPHELVFLGLSVLLGATYLLGAPPPASVVALMPHWVVLLWAAGLAFSGLVGLLALLVFGRWLESSLMAEAGAMLVGAGALVLLDAATISVASIHTSVFGIGFVLAWALANLVRVAQIRRELVQHSKELK